MHDVDGRACVRCCDVRVNELSARSRNNCDNLIDELGAFERVVWWAFVELMRYRQ